MDRYTHKLLFYRFLRLFLLMSKKRYKAKVQKYKQKRQLRSMHTQIDAKNLISISNKAKEADSILSVSVIVPNYNHAQFLRERLDSIYNQTYPIYEVILLDDVSSDNSLEILNEYAAKHPENTRIERNEINSGSPYKQWRKGIGLAKGDLVWIAESDDYSDPAFLANMVEYFKDHAVMLAFAPSAFIKNGKVADSSRLCNADCIPPEAWDKSFVMNAQDFVNDYLGYRNVVINVSACVMRRVDIDTLDHCKWSEYRICGDWILYLNLIAGGRVAYDCTVPNYYRIHEGSTCLSEQKELQFYREHELVAMELVKLYKMRPRTLLLNYESVQRHFLTRHKNDGFRLEDYYSLAKVKEAIKYRKPTILMVCFAFISGGGETFPIELANELRRRGYPVSVMDYAGAPPMESMRKKLLPNIPVYHAGDDIISVFNTINCDLVHTHHGCADATFAAIRQSNQNFHTVVTMHGMYEGEKRDVLDRRMAAVFMGVDHWVYIAEKNVVPFRENGYYSEKLFTKIPNAVPPLKYEAMSRHNFGIPDNAFLLCLASRGIPEKGWAETIAAVTEARRNTGRDIQLLIIGNGEMYDKLLGKAPDYVHMLGFRSDVINFVAMSDAVIVASRFKGESVPMIILEAYLAGKPVISTNVGEVYNMVTHAGASAGLLIELSNDGAIPIDALSDAIQQIATDTTLYNELKSQIHAVAALYDYDLMIERYCKVYQDTINI